MEDKRITKTRKNLKQTLMQMMKTTDFNKITVASLCREADTSRITFYTYYPDKFALVEELMNDFTQAAFESYSRLQQNNNPSHNSLRGYANLLECILEIYDTNYDFMKIVSPDTNPYLYSAFYRCIFTTVDNYIQSHADKIQSCYPSYQTAALLCSGLLSVIHECYAKGTSRESIRESIRSMYRDLLHSNIFTNVETKSADK